MLRQARTTPDGAQVFRDRIGRDGAIAGDAGQIARLADDPWHADWRIHGSPSQPDALFLLVRGDVEPADVPLEPGNDGWPSSTAMISRRSSVDHRRRTERGVDFRPELLLSS